MNPLERSLIEKAGYANGWENVRESTAARVVLFSARHKADAHVTPPLVQGGPWQVTFPKGPPPTELCRTLPDILQRPDGGFDAHGEAVLGKLLRRAAELAMSLPNHAAEIYAEEIAKIEALPPTATEALRLVKQRIGQNLFRQALIDYWGGACAVTGLDLPEALRASHAKPWAKCDTDAERLDVFNGFLLSANLDALFDQGFLTFGNDGLAILSGSLTDQQRILFSLGGNDPVQLRWLSPAHQPYLTWHRENVFRK
jgi:hypothetical protein